LSGLILAVDTALGACSAAICAGSEVLAHRLVPMDRGHAEALAPMVEAVMAEAKVEFAAVERLAVTTGPGTFTGQRIGLAFMRGLRLALECPLIGVSSLAAMTMAACEETGLAQAVAVHDARREEVYIQSQGLKDGVSEPRLIGFEAALDLLRRLEGPYALAGTAAPRALSRLEEMAPQVCMSAIRAPDARFVARLAVAMEPSDLPVKPLYLRPADARLPGQVR
jgi:tRNA threonylcarbamoyladenosine biosynthesis protein TsaB